MAVETNWFTREATTAPQETLSLISDVAEPITAHYRENPECAPGCGHVADAAKNARTYMDAITADMNDVAKAAWWLAMNHAIQWR